jgi:hypothetical protein
VILVTLNNATQGEVQRYENNYKAINLITTTLGRNVYDCVLHLEIAHDVWLKLCNTDEASSKIKSSRKDTYNRQYQTFSQKPVESLDHCFAWFESIVSSLCSCGPLAYSDNEHDNQLLYALDDHVWGMKITALKESAESATLETEKLFSKLKSHKLSCKGRPNHDASLTSKTLITNVRVGGHDANPTTTVLSALEFALSSLAAASNEQYEGIPNDEITLLARKFCALHKFRKERRRSPRGCFECGDTTHFISDCPNRKRLNSSNKYDYTNRNNSSNKDDNKKRYRFRDDNNNNNNNKIMSRACAALSDFDFYSEDSSSSKADEKPKCKKGDFTGLCLMAKSSRNVFNSDSDVSDDLSFESLSLRVAELENALCNQDKLFYKVLREDKKLNLKLESSFSEITSLQSVHDDMSAKPCDNCKIIMIKYVDLWLVHAQVASQLDGAKLKLRELKPCSLLLGACPSCPLLKSDLEACPVVIKELKHKLDHSSCYSVLAPPCKTCGSLKGKFFHATKENTELKQEDVYLTSRLKRTVVSEKMIEDDLSRVEESATKSTYKLGVGFERYEDKGIKSAPKFVSSSNYHNKEETIKNTKTHYPSSPKPSFNPKRGVRKKIPKPREEAFVCMFYGRAGHLHEFCFHHKRIEKRRFDYARNSYRDEFIDFLSRSYSRALSPFFHRSNHRSYGFDSRENSFVPKRIGYNPRSHRADHFLHRYGFPAGESYTHFEPRHLNGPYFPHCGIHPNGSNGEVQRTIKTSSGCMVKC